MPDGFFSPSKTFNQPSIPNRALRCGSCGLSCDAGAVKVKPSGNFAKKILIIMESPGDQSHNGSMVVSGKSGFRVRRALRKFGVDIFEDCLTTSAVRCEPDNRSGINIDSAKHCQPAIIALIKKKKPRAIITIGNIASMSLIETAWNTSPGGLERWVGFSIPSQEWNCWICPTYDPRIMAMKNHPVMEMAFDSHIENAILKSIQRPWEEIPNYFKKVRVVLDPFFAATIIRSYIDLLESNEFAAFDYETNMIKPDAKNARLYSMSICFNGVETIAFPWVGEAIEAAKEFLRSPIKKIAANMKFEDRWTRAICGFPVRRMVWDTMLAEHIMDNRPGICGLKFQAFAYLGMPDYDDHLSDLLISNNPDGTNRIDEIDLKDLLLYNGLDSALTYDIAMKQMKCLRKEIGR